MKALTIRQPWCWAIARGWKNIENRSWTTKYRGPLAIHAAGRWDDEPEECLREVRDKARAQGAELPYAMGDDAPLCNTGLVLAVVDLVDICTLNLTAPFTGCCGEWGVRDQAHWRLENVRVLPEPVPAKGRLGLWDINLAAVPA